KTKSARVISEAFFALNNTNQAKFYLDKYSMSNTLLSRKDIYYAGILAYTQSKYEDAIELFKQVLSPEDSLTQNAAYHLGRCYIEIKNKFDALNSFAIASRSNLDLSIKEDAMFNYAKLSFDLNSDISKFKNYLDTYSPSEQKFNEIQNYIANSYLVNQDYKSAINILQTIKNPTAKEIVNLQKATFLRGIQLINIGSYRAAIPVFELSLSNGYYNNNLANVTQFWLAEAYYRNNQFKRSVDMNLELATKNSSFKGNQEYPTSLYNLAYGYFKIGNFAQAEHWFKLYLNLPHGKILYFQEAMTRLGDSHFMQRKYEEAINAFSSVSASNRELKQYSLYQTSIAKGLLGEEGAKAKLLKELISNGLNNTLYPEVLYELSRTLIQIGEDNSATQYLTELSQKFSNSSYYPKALLELGLINLNKGDNAAAINYYKKILEESPQSPEAQSAIAGLENIYQNRGNAQEFLNYLDGLGLSQTRTPSERELIVFGSAEKQFISGNYAAALSSLTAFIKSYPNGTKAAQAWFYLGESYQKTGKPDLALDAFMKVMEIGEGSFTELATLNYARISYNLENYREAAKAYSSLSLIAKLENNVIESHIGLMNSFFMDKQYENAIAQANKTLLLNIAQQEQIRSKYIIAKSYYTLGNREAAMRYLIELAKNKITPEGAESAYLIISDAFDKGDFEKVEAEVYEFSDSNSPQSYWLAKSYILLGDSFAERENWEQAQATYNSILESYPANSKDDIKEQIKMRLSKIEEKKSKQDETL
ncbi:MAG: tetratricopeptide repeat protein, partial [Bacteroidales bacterium]